MKKTGGFLLFGICVFLLGSCVTLDTLGPSEKKQGQTEPLVKELPLVNFDDLDKDAAKGLVAIEKAKLNALDTHQSFLYTRRTPESRLLLNNKTDYFQFETRKLAFTENTVNPDGTRTLGVVCLSVDALGRRDLSKNRIVYKTDKLNRAEAEAMEASLWQEAKKVRSLTDRQLSRLVKESVKEYQTANQLMVDGIIGRQTIGTMLQHIPVIEIREVSTEVAYPEKPVYDAYIIEASAMTPAHFNRGFESIAEVRKHALSFDEFRQIAEPGKQFYACIYFFDRVSPSYALKWGIATSAAGRAEKMSRTFYARPHAWPMVIESFTTESEFNSSELYVNLYRETQGMLGIPLAKLVASRAIR